MLPGKDYVDWQKATTEKDMQDRYNIQQSEFKKPYMYDDYEDMEYEYPPFPPFPPIPPVPPPGPGPQPPWPDPVPDDPPSPPGPVTDVCRCAPSLCFCPGDTRCGDINCDHPAIKVEVDTIDFGDATVYLSANKKQLCIKAADKAKSLVHVNVKMSQVVGDLKDQHADIFCGWQGYIEECDEDLCGCKKCDGETIGYTTQEMSCGASQTLTVVNSREKCEKDYAWTVTGGGSVSPSTGTSVTYTAAGTNPDCVNNATVTLKIKDEVCATLKIAANCNPESSYYAYRICFPALCYDGPTSPPNCPPLNLVIESDILQKLYNCDNSRRRPPYDDCPNGCGGTSGLGTKRGTCAGSICYNATPQCSPEQVLSECYGWSGTICCNETLDERTAYIKSTGCCPAALL